MLHYDNMSIEIPEWTGREVAELWRMQKNAHVAVCSFWTNPEGAELRLTVDGQVQRTEVSHHLFALPIVALAWKERYHWIKGWRSPANPSRISSTGRRDFDGVFLVSWAFSIRQLLVRHRC